MRNLHEAIARVRDDVEKVEFWADAVSGFSQPVPAYQAGDVNIWVPPEQARSFADTPEADSERTRKRATKRDGQRSERQRRGARDDKG